MSDSPLESLEKYSLFCAQTFDRSTVDRSTVTVWSASPYTGIAEGEVFFRNGCRLRMREELDFADAMITSYGYELYRNGERLYWYDDFPHPHDATLASTYPHHKHIHPNIRHHRIPAPGMSFIRPNLPMIIEEIDGLLQAQDDECATG